MNLNYFVIKGSFSFFLFLFSFWFFQDRVSESMGMCPTFLFSRCVVEVFTFPREDPCTPDWPSTQCSREWPPTFNSSTSTQPILAFCFILQSFCCFWAGICCFPCEFFICHSLYFTVSLVNLCFGVISSPPLGGSFVHHFALMLASSSCLLMFLNYLTKECLRQQSSVTSKGPHSKSSLKGTLKPVVVGSASL